VDETQENEKLASFCFGIAAPASIKSLTTATWPFSEAKDNAVLS
jgi:hypothetical protein